LWKKTRIAAPISVSILYVIVVFSRRHIDAFGETKEEPLQTRLDAILPCKCLSRPFHYSSFSRVVSAHNEEVFSNKTILCCRGRRKTDTYNRSRAVFTQEPRKVLLIDSNDHLASFLGMAPEIDLNELPEVLFRTKNDAI